MNYEIKVFSELNSELKAYWQNLEAKSNGYCFQSYDWFENLMNNFYNMKRLTIKERTMFPRC